MKITKVSFLFISIFIPFVSLAAPGPLTKEQEDKILFMLFENQSRKTVAIDKKEQCSKKNPNTWFCNHSTVKKFLIGALGVGLDQRIHRDHKVECEKITADSKKEMASRGLNEWASIDLKREVSLALSGQWLCTYKFLTVGRNGESTSEGGSETTAAAVPAGLDPQATGISFLMNRDLNRIISRHIVVWRID